MEIIFVGVDISKDVLDYAIVNQNRQAVLEGEQCKNNLVGIKALVKHVGSYASELECELWICMEHTGHYGNLLVSILESKGVKFSVVNSLEIIKSSGISRGKSDKIDALRIAQYASTFHYKLEQYKSPGKNVKLIKSLLSSRDQYVRIRTQLKNALKSIEMNDVAELLKSEITIRRREIKTLDKRINDLEVQIENIVHQDEEISKSHKKLTSIIGVGKITSAKLIVTTNNFKSFDNPRKFSCYCGLAPFPHSSGSSVRGRTKTSKLRNREMKSILFNAASTAILHDQQLRSYYKRKIAQGKHKMVVKNAVANKIVLRVFAVIKREEPYVKLAA